MHDSNVSLGNKRVYNNNVKIIGSSFGIRANSRSSKSQGFGLSVLMIFLYYVISFFSSSLGVKGILNPVLAAWLPVFLSIWIGIYLLARAGRIR